ncbi:Mitochondrial distribution and morphology protein 31 [Smittium mucronatum]|uniref:Mitochondrial distribution and morphology protein 31 n=1 Tax=Smittium mucronatum TaxID=133383 RepID=A0A1R0H7Q4_9FUNG|nr:Mitochondrial distribution and morphology protein 31 [Smittium mucronatum]
MWRSEIHYRFSPAVKSQNIKFPAGLYTRYFSRCFSSKSQSGFVTKYETKPLSKKNDDPYADIKSSIDKLTRKRDSVEKIQNKLEKSNILAQHNSIIRRFFVHIQFALKGSSSGRPWTLDDRMALGSWILLSNLIWIIIGTTTFASVLLFILNKLNLESTVSGIVSKYISNAIGITITIDSTIFPKWKNGKITLKNVNVECGPQHALIPKTSTEQIPDLNFTYYKIKIDEIDVELSLVRWVDGKGIVSSCKFSGIRGYVDRRHVTYDYSVPYIPEEDRKLHRPGYFDFNSVDIEDISITLLNPEFRPINISVYNASLDRLRQQWLFYDILNANSIVGIYDTSLFSIRQLRPMSSDKIKSLKSEINLSGIDLMEDDITIGTSSNAKNSVIQESESDLEIKSNSTINRMREKLSSTHNTTEIKVDNLAISHLNYGVEGPVGWINSGTVDINASVLIPNPNCINYNPSEIFQKIITDLATSIDVVILPSSNDVLNPEVSDSLLVRILNKSGALDSRPAEILKEKTKKKFENEANRRLDLQRKRTMEWEQGSNVENSVKVSEGQTESNEMIVGAHKTAHEILAEAKSNSGANPGTGSLYHNNGKYEEGEESSVYSNQKNENSRFVFLDIQFNFNNIRANVPLTTPHLSYLNSTLLIRPILGYMNSHRVHLPIKCQLRVDIENFDGSWNAYDSDLVYLVSDGIGEAFAKMVVDQRERSRRLKQIGIWSVSEMAKQLTLFLEYVTGFKGFWQYVGNTSYMPGVPMF